MEIYFVFFSSPQKKKEADLLRGDYKQSDYGKIILPMTVLRRLDCVIAPTKQKVLDYMPKIEKLSDSAKDITLNKVAGLNFHNRRNYDFAKIAMEDTPQLLEALGLVVKK